MGENGLSVADALALRNGGNNDCNDGFGGANGAWWIIILILFFGWNRNGFNNGYGNGNENGMNGALTRGDLCMDMNFNDLQGAVRSNAAENNSNFRNVDNAVCQLGYQNAQLVNGVQASVDGGFARLDTNLCQSVNNLTQQINGVNVGIMQAQNALASQFNNCCCDVKEAISGVNYNMAMNSNNIQQSVNNGFCQTNFNAQSNTRDIIESQNANTRAILDKLTQQELAAKDAQIASQNQQIFSLQLRASQEAQNAYLVNQLGQKCPVPAYLTCNPNAPLNYAINYNNGNSCGCC